MEALTKLQEEEYAPGEVIWLPLDMSDPRLAKKGAEDFMSREKRLDVLGACSHEINLRLGGC